MMLRVALLLVLFAVPLRADVDNPQALFESGAWDKLIELGGTSTDAKVLALAGEALMRSGEHDRAVAVLARGGADRWCRALTGLSHRARGRAREAAALFEPIIHDVDLSSTVVSDLWALAVAQRESNRFQAALDALSRAQELEPDDPRTGVMIGELFVSKYQVSDAMKELERVTEKNKAQPFALAAEAEVLADHGRFEEAREAASKALAANPRLAEPHLVRARILEYEEDYASMLSEVAAAKKLSGGSAESLTREAIGCFLSGDQAGFATAEKACLAVKPDCAQLYCALGESCATRRRNEDALKFYRQALKMDPDYAEAESEMGNLHMREGNEEEARVHLERAWQLDQFNYRTKNFLELLDYMDREFAVRLSPSFVFKVDEKNEGFLADVFLPEMERFYPELCKHFCWSPKERVIVELFPANDWFAARISGTPWIGITGGCFGRVIAAESPRVNPGSSHRTEVLLHEITHAINLQQTKRKLPMWLAEGLAVQEEHSAGGPMWPALLRRGLGVGDILPVSNLNAGFTRAKNMGQRQLAYYQASLVVAELKKRFGFAKILEMLAKFGEGKPQADVFSTIFGLDAAALDQLGMDAWKAAMRASPRRAVYAPDDVEALRKRAAKDDVWQQGELLWGLMSARNTVEALSVAKALMPTAKTDPAVAALIGDFARSRQGDDKAKKFYEAALAKDPRCYHALLGLAGLAAAANDSKTAEAQLSAAAAAWPNEPEPVEKLRKLHEAAHDEAKLLADVETQAKLDLHTAEPWLVLARMRVARQEWKLATDALTELISIDTYNPELHQLRAQVAEATGDRAGALAAWTVHWRLRVYPYLPQSKKGEGLDVLKAAVKNEGTLSELGAIAAADALDTKDSADWLAALAHEKGEVGHRAALALARALDPRALAPLMGALGCAGPDRCGERALEALRRMTARGFTSPAEWKGWAATRAARPREDWVLESFEAAGFKAKWDEPAEEVPVLLKALEAKDWWVRENAWRELAKSAKFAYGRGAFGPDPKGMEADYAQLRKEATERFRAWWERYKGRM